MRHINSKKQDKQEKALRAVDIICMHPDIFEIKSEYIDHKEMLKTFVSDSKDGVVQNRSNYCRLT